MIYVAGGDAPAGREPLGDLSPGSETAPHELGLVGQTLQPHSWGAVG
jgi:hypothetical protein